MNLRLLERVGIQLLRTLQLYYDNKVAISIAHDLVQHDRTTKNNKVDRNFIK